LVVASDGGGDRKKAEVGIKDWLDAVAQCSTLSRLNVLIGILESCIKWEKSAENAVYGIHVTFALLDGPVPLGRLANFIDIKECEGIM